MQPAAQQVIDAVQAHNYALVVVLLLIASVAFVRKITPRVSGRLGAFLNSDRGGSLLVLLLGGLGAVGTSLVAGKHLSLSLVVGSIMTAAAASGGWNIVWDLLAPSDKKEPPKLSESVPPPGKAALLLPFLLIPTLLLSSCATTGGQVMKSCELGQLSQQLQPTIVDVFGGLSSGDWGSRLGDLVGRVGLGQLNCVVQAVVASTKAQVPQHGQADPALVAVIVRGQQWLAEHPAK
jgi:hypothetical protein